MKIIVQKFGGTSVSTPERRRRAAERVKAAADRGLFPVVVVSAMGRAGEPYATDTLLSLAKEAGSPAHPRDLDMLMSCGEIISAVVMASLLRGQGVEAHAVTGRQAGIRTNEAYGNAEYLYMDPAYLHKLMDKGVVPVVAGFQGFTGEGDITTLGRGGSDTTASILGVGLGAEAVEIYTDVEGIMTADPRIVPEAGLLRDMSYEEVFQMADNGSKVIHPRAVDIAMRGGIPLVVRGTMTDDPGTTISGKASRHSEKTPDDVVTSIAHIAGRLQATVDGLAAGEEHGLLEKLASCGISIDLINIFPDYMVFTVADPQRDPLLKVLDGGGYRYRIREDCCKVSAIGVRMRGVPGVMSRILRALHTSGVSVLQTVDSHMTISCLVPGSQAEQAVRSLHSEFRLDQRPTETA